MEEQKRITPQISFEHVLAELSVNRQNPCEIIRELISNSYDASAEAINIIPLVDDNNGIIYFDSGKGLNQKVKSNDITPYEAFFSIGKSTKQPGEGIGYKCQGSKLCFASSRFALITKTKDDLNWWFKLIENPKHVITQNYDITPETCENPWVKLRELFSTPTALTSDALNYLNESFFKEKFEQGTLIVLIGLQVENFREYFSPQSKTLFQKSYLYNYIRFFTKHGDIRITSHQHGFRNDHILQMQNTKGINNRMTLSVLCEKEFLHIPLGYPYLSITEHHSQIASPLNVSRLRDGRFCDRYAKVIALHGVNYTFTIAIDGNRRALDGYPELDRRGKKVSGIRLTDQRGTFISAQGIKICAFNELFDNPELANFAILQEADAISHFVLFIDGPFKLVTNRNSLSNESIKELSDRILLNGISTFLNDFRESSTTFRELCQRLSRERADDRRESQVEYLKKSKEGISIRERFILKGIDLLNNKWFVSPELGEEHWVGALYAMLENFVPKDNVYQTYWLRPLTFASLGIDSICQKYGSNSLDPKNLIALEYKYHFCPQDVFNHPLNITDYIVCWTSDQAITELVVSDDYDCFGTITPIDNVPIEIAYKINDIQSKTGDIYNKSTYVIVLRKLIEKTFDSNFIKPPSQIEQKRKSYQGA